MSNNLKHLGISGGGTKIAGLFGAARYIMEEKGYTPNVISGISAGAILSVPLALKKYDVIEKLVKNFTMSDFFSEKPVSDDGSFQFGAILKAITGKPFLGRQDNLEKTLAKVVSRAEFEAYRKDSHSPVAIVGTVNFKDSSRWYFNLKEDPEITYEKFLKVVNASASLPLFTNGIEIRHRNEDLYLYDGGTRDHSPTGYILGKDEKYKGLFNESVTIFSRPEDYKLVPNSFKDRNIIDILERYVDVSNIEVSKNDEYQEKIIAKEQNVKLWQVYLPSVMKSVYDTNSVRLNEIYAKGRFAAADKYPTRPVNLDLIQMTP